MIIVKKKFNIFVKIKGIILLVIFYLMYFYKFYLYIKNYILLNK